MEKITKDQIRQIEEALLQAIKNNDADFINKILHDNLIFHIPNGKIITKQMDIDAHRSGSMTIHSLKASEQIIKIFGDTAIVSVLIQASGKGIDQSMQGSFRYIRVWKSFDGKLKVIGGSCIQLS